MIRGFCGVTLSYSVHLGDAELSASAVYHDSNSTEVIADHYDLVVSGVELGRGSRHIHNAAVQEFILRDSLQMRPKRLVNFENLLDGLRAIFSLYVGLAWDLVDWLLLCWEEVGWRCEYVPKDWGGRGGCYD